MAGTCASCGHPQEQRFCQRCGEERLEPGQLTVWYFVTRILPAEIFDFDGKIWRTLRLLLCRPGFLAVEYAAGRRRPYVKPWRVLLTAIIAYALLMPSGSTFTLGSGNPHQVQCGTGAAAAGTEHRRHAVSDRPVRHPSTDVRGEDGACRQRHGRNYGALQRHAGRRHDATFLASVLLFALVLYACFNRRRPLMLEHAVFSMHYFSFVLVSTLMQLAVFSAAMALQGFRLALPFLLAFSVWQLTYLGVAIRRFYSPEPAGELRGQPR